MSHLSFNTALTGKGLTAQIRTRPKKSVIITEGMPVNAP